MRKAGKKVGSCVYVHRLYENEAIPYDVLRKAKIHLPTDEDYECVKYDKKTGNVTFQWSKDFNSADEPTVGMCILVKPDGSIKKILQKKDPQIWHHKWLWVGDDYTGFDVEESKKRSKTWEPYVNKDEKKRIGTLSFWNKIKSRWISD
jgi:hypothetical protein